MDPTVAAPTPDRVASSQSGIDSGQPHSAVSDEELLATINQMLRRAWQEAGMGPSPPATDSEWCRRVYLDIVGRIPSIEELDAFLRDRPRDKRARLVDRLLGEEYIEQYARNWTTIWTNTLVGRSGGQTPGSLVNREGLQQFLRRAMLHNKPYDQIVEELLSAEGANTPGEEGFNGAVNFLLDNLDENGVTAAAKTGQIFLGVQIQCTQCHNHPFNEWQQDQFWGLNAFFRQARGVSLMDGAAPRSARLEDVDFAGELGDPQEAEIFYELRNGQLRAAYPTFIDGVPINPSGLVDQVNRRDELARLVVQSPYLGQALVNRIWSHFFGYGFTKPVDDMGPHNSPSHPELLERLGAHFVAGGHDLKRLLRVIALTDAYSLSSRFGPKYGNQSDDPSQGTPAWFSHFYLRQLTAEQLYDSLLAITDAHRTQGSFEEQQRLKEQWLEQFTIAFGTDDNEEATTFNGTITQALMMMNGDLTRRATTAEPGTFLHQLATTRRSGHVERL
ncbi:MAG: DUF1549 domain-containing protein, partial [Pirellulales bacterium]